MFNLLVLCLLVASAAGLPRGRGGPLHRSIHAESGRPFNYNQNAAAVQGSFGGAFQQAPVALSNQNQVPAVHQSQVFQVDPNTFQPVDQRLAVQHGIITTPTPSSEIVKRLIGNPPGGALLVGTHPPLFPIEQRLISNYTLLRPVVTDTFRCDRASQPNYVGYGYYADVDNDCQIFHVCLPWKELYPKAFDTDVTYQFSFICPNQTVFSQDSLTCTWQSDAIPCAASPQLYWLNSNFFRKVDRADGFGERYAHVNEKLEPLPLKYDYDDFDHTG